MGFCSDEHGVESQNSIRKSVSATVGFDFWPKFSGSDHVTLGAYYEYLTRFYSYLILNISSFRLSNDLFDKMRFLNVGSSANNFHLSNTFI